MSNIIPDGSYNAAAITAPGVIVQIIPPNQNLFPGITTNSIGWVGVGSWGPINSPTIATSAQSAVAQFGKPLVRTFDMVTGILTAAAQNANFFYCVRVADGSEDYAVTTILDTDSIAGLVLTAKYTGIVGNSLQAVLGTGSQFGTFKLTVSLPNVAPEVYDNISGSGAAFWTNLMNAVNLGQSSARPPSNLVVASLFGGITGVTITVPGSYTAVPAASATVGSGATFTVKLGILTYVLTTPQSSTGSYAPGDTITLTGGTATTFATLNVLTTQVVSATVAAGGSGGTPGTQTVTGTTGTGTKFQASVTVSGGGAITAIISITVAGSYTVNPTSLTAEPVTGASLSDATLNIKMGVLTSSINAAGAYTVLPSSPISQGSSSGSGTGATFTVSAWKLTSILVTAPGIGYTSSSVLNLTLSGGGTGTLQIGSSIAPALATYTFTGGLDGATGVLSSTLIGNDTSTPRTGMYALRSTDVDQVVLQDVTDNTTWTTQTTFGVEEGAYMQLVDVAGQTIAQTIMTKNSAGLDTYACKLMLGNWVYWFDSFNNVTRVVSPQGFIAGRLANLTPQLSSLNKPVYGVVGTTMSQANLRYTNGDEQLMASNGLDTIDKQSGVPGAFYFSALTGQNTSSGYLTNDDNYTRVTNYLAISIANGVALYVGQSNDADTRNAAAVAVSNFMQENVRLKIIDRFSVQIGTSPNVYTAEFNVQVVDKFTLRVFLVNLQTGDVTLTSVSPAPVTPRV